MGLEDVWPVGQGRVVVLWLQQGSVLRGEVEMNEEQIKAIAMEVAKSMHEGFLWKEGCGWESGIIPSEVREFVTRFLTRIDAERGKEAVAWALFAENGNIRIWSSAPEEVKKLAEEQGMTLLPLYLSPAIPEGWALVPIEPTEAMLKAADDGDRDYTTRNFGAEFPTVTQGPYDHYCAMLAAAKESK